MSWERKGNLLLCKVDGKTKGFVYETPDKTFVYAFGLPSQSSYIAFYTDLVETAKARVEESLIS